MDVAQALADLKEISSQIDAAVLFAAGGAVQGSTLAADDAAQALAAAGAALLERADALRGAEAAVTQVEVALAEGCVFVVRDGERLIAATSVPNPTVGLVFYDLKSCLRDSAPDARSAPDEKPKPKRARKKVEE
jgi:predicted regulator of Ras-like GTPase activity (Roadblock/LC7/MglB family)